MIELDNIHPLTDFKRDTARFRRRLKTSGRPAVLTVDGRAELVVQDAKAYQQLLDALERAQAIAGIREGAGDARAGRMQTLEEFDRAFRRRHKLRKGA